MHGPRSHYVDSFEFSRTFYPGLHWFDHFFGLRQSDEGINRHRDEDTVLQTEFPLGYARDKGSSFAVVSIQILSRPGSDPLVPNLHNLIHQTRYARDTRWTPFNHRMEEWL